MDSEEKIARVADILEQIERLNNMIDLHRQSEDNSMRTQYEYMRDQFVAELNVLMTSFKLSGRMSAVAA